MTDEKKKGGFWSWLGLGKKQQENADEQQQETVEIIEQTSGNKSENIVDIIEEKIEAVNEKIDQSIEQVSDTLSEDMLDVVENFVQSETTLISEQNETVLEPVKTEQIVAEISVQKEDVKKTAVEIEPVSEIVNDEILKQETTKEKFVEPAIAELSITQEKPTEGGFFSRLIKGLVKTKQNIGSGFRAFFLGKKIDDELFEELEEQLLIADIGVPTTSKIIKNLELHASRQQLKNADLLYQQLKQEMAEILNPVAQPLHIDEAKKPYVILMVGVNGVGKTTTIGKLARQFQQQGKSVMLAAGDTFRAAAVEQLQVWGERNHIPVVAQSTGSDSASVIFDAMQSAAAKNIDILIADTAGRLQNKNNLMDELKKIVRVMKKYDETAPHEIMLTLDAGTGQNAISQAKLFNEAVGLTGICLTKLDGTAKGGVIFAIADQFNLPIRYIGVGEKIEDLRTFNANEFIDALFSHEE
ncbi:signal recognition particle-docking protein FtsY [Lonepinella koalarum]|uniref:Signal recognition particle receptor FtsY n=1 Tax=Lonepinella koalarum TaxID=53417 RepID=A0A4R1L2K3_9PAST|nr:signal recognition particle-docking protein FtsY [Lonepinella koalarum]MDH2925982.1 signal recognition particle-docking protein FtsY [Lonepinella koalarum]TCK71133.1 fused signal recognition particle receptor [Lonepinella koalarum]TFJ90862.1 signal recognition particle-docking protein FtsY [Lonepinella koalarum]